MQRQPNLAQGCGDFVKILAGVTFFQKFQDSVVDGFHCAGDKQTAGLLQRRKQVAMLLEMFDFDGRVVANFGKFGVIK